MVPASVTEIAEQLLEMEILSNETGHFQNRVIGGFSVNLYRSGRNRKEWMVGCAMLLTDDKLQVLQFIEDRQVA